MEQAPVVPHDETRTVARLLTTLFNQSPSNGTALGQAVRLPRCIGSLEIPFYLRAVLREQALPLGFPRKREALGAWRTDGGTDRRVDRTGYAGTGGRLTIVSGQEGGHRAPDAPGERQTTRQRSQQTAE
ncbi:hypothetical protein K0M31_004363 [Melipona bicolor]|uniref:Uncharacterized protein n=1 Tax=Melipona bicolor TaxID=60889 RepID=A0AA40KNA3_9HYME|nr:hypothetical protein K0M31_004363 [Melipona bicolor]